jgi:MFS transporter, DHA1 family, inner membrane transport protein
MSRRELSILLTLAAIQFTHILDGMIMMPMAPSIRGVFDISTQEFGFLVSSYGLAAFVSAIAATFWIDAFDRKKVLMFLYTGFILGTLACAFVPSYGWFLAARTFTGFFGGVAGAVILSIVGDLIAQERRAQGMGILMTGFALASVVGVPLGIFLSEKFSWQAPFFFICALGVPVMALVAFVIPPVNAHLQGGRRPGERFLIYRSLASDMNLVRALLLSFTVIVSHGAIIPFISDYLVNNLGFVMDKQVIFMYVLGGALSTVFSPITGRIADRYGRMQVFVVMSILAMVPIYLVSNLGSASMVVLLIAAGMFFVFSGGRMIPSQAIITSTIPPHLRGRFMSLNSATQQLAMGLSTLVGGLIIQNDAQGRLLHYPVVGYVGIAMALISIGLVFGVKQAVEVKGAPSK